MLGWLRNLLASRPRAREEAAGPGSAAYHGLRIQALSIERASVGIPAPPADAPIWAVLMEMGFANGTATLFAAADGTTSLYYSGGGGVIGMQGHETVRRANVTLLAQANRSAVYMRPTSAFTLPTAGVTLFYARTDAGVLTGSGSDDDLGRGRHDLSSLFHAGHAVLTELRLICEGGGSAT